MFSEPDLDDLLDETPPVHREPPTVELRNKPSRLDQLAVLLRGFGANDIIALVMVLSAFAFGFIGGWLHRDLGFGFLVLSAEVIVVGILAGVS